MYKDNSLIPSEAVRLAALGLLNKGRKSYADLAREVRHFTARIAGPSLDLLGPSLALLSIEGLIAPVDSHEPLDRQILQLTDDGKKELLRLMIANIRGPMSEINKLIVALKIHFLDCLNAEQQESQLSMLIEICEREIVRLRDLSQNLQDASPLMQDWLRREIAEAETRRDWFQRLLKERP